MIRNVCDLLVYNFHAQFTIFGLFQQFPWSGSVMHDQLCHWCGWSFEKMSNSSLDWQFTTSTPSSQCLVCSSNFLGRVQWCMPYSVTGVDEALKRCQTFHLIDWQLGILCLKFPHKSVILSHLSFDWLTPWLCVSKVFMQVFQFIGSQVIFSRERSLEQHNIPQWMHTVTGV